MRMEKELRALINAGNRMKIACWYLSSNPRLYSTERANFRNMHIEWNEALVNLMSPQQELEVKGNKS